MLGLVWPVLHRCFLAVVHVLDLATADVLVAGSALEALFPASEVQKEQHLQESHPTLI